MSSAIQIETDVTTLPRHVGIIMDGNGRWAKQRSFSRSRGHDEGLKTTKKIVKYAAKIGIEYLSIYIFSTENWKRTEEEVSFLMRLVKNNIRKQFDFYRENGIRLVHSGDITGLPKEIKTELLAAMDDTAHFPGMTLNLALNYGGRDEIVRAFNRWLGEFRNNGHTPEFTESCFHQYLDVPNIPEPDLIIRTGGEQRISNFLLWGAAYAELFFSNKLWPDFQESDFDSAILDYQRRTRRFGGVV